MPKPTNKVRKSDTVNQADAKNDLNGIWRRVVDEGIRVYVTDHSGEPFLTFTSSEKNVREPVIEVTRQFLKSNFARCSSLARVGFCFCITDPSSKRVVYLRHHTSYTDPLKPLLDRWHQRVAEVAVRDLSDEFRAFAKDIRSSTERDRDSERQCVWSPGQHLYLVCCGLQLFFRAMRRRE